MAVRTFVYTRFVVAWLEHSDATGSIIDSLPLDPTIRAFLRGLERLTDHEPFASTDHRLQTLTRAAAPQLASKPDPVVYLFDRYEAALDQDSRHHRGVFYTPTVVVDAVVGSVDRRLRERFDLPLGLADRTTPHARTPRMNGTAEAQDTSTPFVCILDPAAGTGAFLLGVLRRVRATLFASFEPTHTPTQIDQWAAFLRDGFLARLLAVEQSVPSAIAAHLRFGLALVRTGVTARHFAPDDPVLRLTITSTLSQPSAQPHARRALLDAPVTVILGNPPYRREPAQRTTAHRGGWIRDGWTDWQQGRPPLLDFVEPVKKRGAGGHLKNLYNQYVYFWRWAVWRVFEHGPGTGIVGLVTGASFLRGPGFAGLRQHLTNTWTGFDVIDLGGDTRGPRASENVFGVTVPVCITVGWTDGRVRSHPASTQRTYRAVSGDRAAKLVACTMLARPTVPFEGSTIEGDTSAPWVAGEASSAYRQWPRIADLFPWQHSGVQFKRTWPIAVSKTLLHQRWTALLAHPDRDAAFRSTAARRIDRAPPPIHRGAERAPPLEALAETAPPPVVARYAHRPFDPQHVLVDARLCDRPRAVLWRVLSPHQLFLTTRPTGMLGEGPAALVSTSVPDLHHFRGSYGGRDVIPLWRDGAAQVPNLTPGLLDALEGRLGLRPEPRAVMEYAYAVLSQSGFVSRFAEALKVPGLRLPLTADATHFREGVVLGAALIARHIQPQADPPSDPPPRWIRTMRANAHPTSAEVQHDPERSALHIGHAVLAPVSTKVMAFSVSGYPVVEGWIRQRLGHRGGRRRSPLDHITPSHWLPEWSAELPALIATIAWTLNQQATLADWLDAVVQGPLITQAELPAPSDNDQRAPRT